MLNVKPSTIFCHDNIDVLRGINSGCVDLIYLDPPFNKNKQFTAPIGSAAEGASFSDIFRRKDVKDEWVVSIAQDNPELYNLLKGIETFSNEYNYCYCVYMAIRLLECRRILKTTGSIYFHCDQTMSHYMKLVMDCVFGEGNFRNEIAWCYPPGGQGPKYGFHKKHDCLLYYGKSEKAGVFHREYSELTPQAAAKFTKTDAAGRKYKEYPGGKSYLGEAKGRPVPDWWTDIHSLGQAIGRQNVGYPTQKPLALLERVIRASSNEGDMVLDPFCGCATTCVAAERLGREWIGIDVSEQAFTLVKMRLKREVPPDMYRRDPAFRVTPPKRDDDGAADDGRQKFVYIISNKQYPGEYKVGVALDVNRRLNTYQTADPERAYKVEFQLRTAHYNDIEKYIHGRFDNRHEWVRGELGAIKRAITNWRP